MAYPDADYINHGIDKLDFSGAMGDFPLYLRHSIQHSQADGVNQMGKIKTQYFVICDCEVMFTGNKKECVDYWLSLPRPVTMQLLRCVGVHTLNCNLAGQRSIKRKPLI